MAARRNFARLHSKVRLKADGCPVYFFTQAQAEDYLKRAGFRVDSHEILGQLHCIRSTAILSQRSGQY